jgi:AAA domain
MAFYVFDLDGTLADCGHRVHHVTNGKHNWDAFFNECDKDKPIWGVIDVLKSLVQLSHDRVEIWSARSETVREKTVYWLLTYGINPELLKRMRPVGDFTKDTVLKKKWLEESRMAGTTPTVIFDDRQSVVDMWRANGVPCFQVTASEWDKPETKNLSPPKLGQQKLILLVGPSGAGKSTYASTSFNPCMVISTDQIRYELTGNTQDQTRNDDVFEAVRRIVTARLSAGLSAVIDATHLRRKTRLEHAKLALSHTQVEYHIIDRPLVQKVQDGGWRNEVFFDNPIGTGKPDQMTLIEHHAQMFGSQIKDILRGDGDPKIVVKDFRQFLSLKTPPTLTDGWKYRRDSAMPFQTWTEFPPETLVEVRNKNNTTGQGLAKNFWWGYETEAGEIGEGVIIAARRLTIGQTK